MSTETPVDLSTLRIDDAPPRLPRRPLAPRLLALVALLLVLAVAATFAWPLLRPVRTVAVAPVRPAAAGTQVAAETMAEAVGWVEADPFPVVVRPLVAGRIEALEVLETFPVRAGETVIARLQSAELLAAHERAVALVAEREQELAEAEARRAQAAAELQQNAARRTATVEARVRLAEKRQELAEAKGSAAAAGARERGAAAALDAQRELQAAGSSNEVALARAAAEACAAAAEAAAARERLQAVEDDVEAAQAALQLADELAAAPVDLQGVADVAAAAAARAAAALALARAELAIAERELGWTEVTAPVSGNVLRLLAQPGDTVGPEGAGIVSIYDPARLRARIDVPFASIGAVHAGQQVELQSEVTGRSIVRGVVQRLQPESDLLKNTLQVKIGLVDPPPLWKPETLVRARFQGSGQDGDEDQDAARVRRAGFRVPQGAVKGGLVFVFDPAAGRARPVPVEVTGQQGDDAVVRGELSVTQRVILDDVSAGEAVAPEAR